ncbi:MAG: ferredoxin [Ruminococcaceae bacterium]|jgi:ferredoxin|nr:ferredoxin [Oscillospiraceae bacterium]
MKFIVNSRCVGCGLCAGTCPEIFQLNSAGAAEAVAEEVSNPLEDAALAAMDACPVGAIEQA